MESTIEILRHTSRVSQDLEDSIQNLLDIAIDARDNGTIKVEGIDGEIVKTDVAVERLHQLLHQAKEINDKFKVYSL